MKLQTNLRYNIKQNWKQISPPGWKLLKAWNCCPSIYPTPQLKLPKGKSSLSFLHTKWKLQFRKNLFCHVILSKSRNSIPKGRYTIMALNKMPQLLNQYHLGCTGLRLNRKIVCCYTFFLKSRKGNLVPVSLLQYSLCTSQKTLLPSTDLHCSQVHRFYQIKILARFVTFITIAPFMKPRYLSTLESVKHPHLWTLFSLISSFQRKVFPASSVLSFLLVS